MDYYVIKCKNGYPPANKYTITNYGYRKHDLPYTFRDCIRYSENGWVTILNNRYFVCIADDPAEAMTKFWMEYMYNK